jgi:hypothetical protein
MIQKIEISKEKFTTQESYGLKIIADKNGKYPNPVECLEMLNYGLEMMTREVKIAQYKILEQLKNLQDEKI